ncbi:hypothetical protein CALVIDRAFT_566179 [Calocera viscosa TUFC12733]|uniref:Uncharacterized protein n=1 Tax=Calocera viscosa (strain TUFC12733) TaxID=1330018 RepID=A0A167JVK8_CALVF|nr:hypothetical protein CALVIDRAFT_566179 [Calocera viscosa TUFC12733]
MYDLNANYEGEPALLGSCLVFEYMQRYGGATLVFFPDEFGLLIGNATNLPSHWLASLLEVIHNFQMGGPQWMPKNAKDRLTRRFKWTGLDPGRQLVDIFKEARWNETLQHYAPKLFSSLIIYIVRNRNAFAHVKADLIFIFEGLGPTDGALAPLLLDENDRLDFPKTLSLSDLLRHAITALEATAVQQAADNHDAAEETASLANGQPAATPPAEPAAIQGELPVQPIQNTLEQLRDLLRPVTTALEGIGQDGHH